MSRAHDIEMAALARSQGGVLTAQDLTSLTGRDDELDRRVRSGLWREVVAGAVVPAAMPDEPGLLATALCRGVPRSVLSHHDAARHVGIWVPDTDLTWLTVPFGSPLREVPGVRIVRSRAFPDEFLRRGELRISTPSRTVVDLGMVLTRKQLEAVLLSAVRQDVLDVADVEAHADRLRGRKGIAMVRAVTALWSAERESLLEDLLFGDVCAVTSGAVRQLPLPGSDGRPVARADVAVPELRVRFEADGLRYHSTDAQIAADQAQDRLLLTLGWLTVRFREGVLDGRHAVRREIAAVLDRRRHDLRRAA